MRNVDEQKTPSKIIPIIIFILAFSSMFLGFYRNQWRMAGKTKFSLFQKDVEGYVIARMVWSRQHGLLSNGGLLGWGDVNPEDINEADYQNQYEVYLQGLSFKTYWQKESHPGFQGLFFSILDRLSPFTPLNNFRLFRMFTSGLFALTLAGLVLWFYGETGWLSALFVLLSILTSQWMTVFGRNLFFVSGFFYLPMLVLLFQLQREKAGHKLSYAQLFGLVFAFILLKCMFNGYDFILPTLGMVASPLLFYGVLEKWNRDLFIKRFVIVVIAALTAIFFSFVVLSLQLAHSIGGFQDGINAIIKTINIRTIASDQSLPTFDVNVARASYWSILKIYLSESYFLNLQVPYFAIMIGFAVFSLVYVTLVRSRSAPNRSLRGDALLATTWLSLLSPLSWYIIFKSVSYYHTHMNYLPWHMPFTLFGFGLCGYIIETIFSQLKSKTSIVSKPH